MKQLIKFPTRSTLTSQTVSNRSSHIINSGIFTTGFSDHGLIYSIRKISFQINHEPKIIKPHQLKVMIQKGLQKSCKQLIGNLLGIHTSDNDVNIMSLQWARAFVCVLDNHAQICQCKVRNSYAPHIDKDLKHKMFLCDFYKKHFNKTKNPKDWKVLFPKF